MRSYDKSTLKGRIWKKTCGYIGCEFKTFYTTNPKAKHCCDYCKLKTFEYNHAPDIAFMKKFKEQFKVNAKGLEQLLKAGIIFPTSRDFKIVKFDFSVREAETLTSDGRTAFTFFDYILVRSKDGNSVEIIYKPKKK